MLFGIILNYQYWVLVTFKAFVTYSMKFNLPFFYVEDILHFFVLIEIVTFCSNLVAQITFILFASLYDKQYLRANIVSKRDEDIQDEEMPVAAQKNYAINEPLIED
jgi:hypothetical protein